jgi:hypothetical protein
MSVAGPDRNGSPDRRKPGERVPFEALVEIAAPEGASFEAESVDLSSSGMHLRTAYVPAVGTPLTFRFEPGAGDPVVARGTVVWTEDSGAGAEFGVRFEELAPQDAAAIEQIVGERIVGSDRRTTTIAGVGSANGPSATRRTGPVRIHIEGMAAPMRATLRADAAEGAIATSELKMLRLGVPVEIEDKEDRSRRAARVDGVDCEIDPKTRVPQLIVRLRYEGVVGGDAKNPNEPARDLAASRKAIMPETVESSVRTPSPTPRAPESESTLRAEGRDPDLAHDGDRPSSDAASPDDGAPEGEIEVARSTLPVDAGSQEPAAKVAAKLREALGGAAVIAARLGARAQATVKLLGKRGRKPANTEAPQRRTTASFGGATSKPRSLRPQGQREDGATLGRDEDGGAMQEFDEKKATRRRQIGIAAGVSAAIVLGVLAFRKPEPKAPIVQAPAPELAPAPPPVEPVPAPLPADAVDPLAAAPALPPPLVGDSTGLDAKGNPNPFGTASIKKGTKMVLRLDGPVPEIKGMPMPNGFVVSVPNRKSLEAAGPLAAKDPRISTAKVVNQPGGAELTIAFRDGSAPSYVVRAKGDAIEIVLAKEKTEKAVAKKGGTKKPAGKQQGKRHK